MKLTTHNWYKTNNLPQNNSANKNDIEIFSMIKSIFEKELSINKYLEVGQILKAGDLKAKKIKVMVSLLLNIRILFEEIMKNIPSNVESSSR